MVLARVDDIGRRQHGIVTWLQLVGCGVPPATIVRWRRGGRLERVAPDVYRLPGSPATWCQEVMIDALTTAGYASHRTAAHLWSLDGFPATVIEVVTPRWKRRARTGFIVHESTSLRDVDLDVCRGIPCTSLVRTLIDLPAVCSLDRAGLALDHARRRDPDILSQVQRRFLEVARRGRRGTKKLRLLLADRTGVNIPTESYFEHMFLRVVRHAELPEPVTQFEIRTPGGTYRVDFAWPAAMVYAECNGYAFHSSKRAVQRDSVRRRALVLAGWRPLEFTYDDVARTPDHVTSEIRAALRTRLTTGLTTGLTANLRR
jgi:very-short-patch-repair endonuclease